MASGMFALDSTAARANVASGEAGRAYLAEEVGKATVVPMMESPDVHHLP
jgi:hypothetical protein